MKSARPKPTVAILSPYYDRAAGVEPTFQSIAHQTYPDFEAIIWDDKSKDGTWSEMQRVVAKLADSRFTIYRHDSNLGFTQGLNLALSKTDADYIAIVGSGDSCDPRRIERQVQALESNPDAVFCATASTTTDPLSGVTFFDSDYSKEVITFSDIAEHCPFTHGSVMYRGSAIRAAGGYEAAYVWCADWDLWFRLLRDRNALFLREVLYRRIAQPDGASFNPEKSIVQIAHKHLAIELSRVDEELRTKILTEVRAAGISSVIPANHLGYTRDLVRRNIKLYLMGRRAAGDTMSARLRGLGVIPPAKYRAFLLAAKLLSRLPFRTDGLIRPARALPR